MTTTETLSDLRKSASGSERLGRGFTQTSTTIVSGDSSRSHVDGVGEALTNHRTGGSVATPEQLSPVRGPMTSPRRRRRGRLGSRQRVSYRGRRLAPLKEKRSRWGKLFILAMVALVAGIASVMLLSGLTTQKTFEISEAENRSQELSNELVTLERDVENAKSAQNLAARAAEMGMVVPDQPGILDAKGDAVEERREAEPEKTRPISDVNGRTETKSATSDPQKTDDVPGLAPESPEGAAAANNLATGDVPYAPNARPDSEPDSIAAPEVASP